MQFKVHSFLVSKGLGATLQLHIADAFRRKWPVGYREGFQNAFFKPLKHRNPIITLNPKP